MVTKLSQKLKKRHQVMHNKYNRFCLTENNMHHVFHLEFRYLNWLPLNKNFEECFNTVLFRFVNRNWQTYLNKVFEFPSQFWINQKKYFLEIKPSFSNDKQKSKIFIICKSLATETSF